MALIFKNSINNKGAATATPNVFVLIFLKFISNRQTQINQAKQRQQSASTMQRPQRQNDCALRNVLSLTDIELSITW